MPKKFLDLEPIAKGSEHIVCLSPQHPDEVIKVPCAWWHNANAEELQAEMKIIKNESIPILDTEVVGNVTVQIREKLMQVPYIIKQAYSDLPTLNTNNLNLASVRDQLCELLQKSVNIRSQQGKSIDFLGAEAVSGLFKHWCDSSFPLHVHNFRINDNEQIILSDTGLLSPDKCLSVLRWPISQIISLQHYLIEGFVQTIDSEFKLENFQPGMLVQFVGGSMLGATSAWNCIRNR